MKMGFLECAVGLGTWEVPTWAPKSWFRAEEDMTCTGGGTPAVLGQPPHFTEKEAGRGQGFLENLGKRLAEQSLA